MGKGYQPGESSPVFGTSMRIATDVSRFVPFQPGPAENGPNDTSRMYSDGSAAAYTADAMDS